MDQFLRIKGVEELGYGKLKMKIKASASLDSNFNP